VRLVNPSISNLRLLSTRKGGGGGGERSPLPASQRRLAKAAKQPFTPPSATPRDTRPVLVMEPALVLPADVQLPTTVAQLGDPLALPGPPSNGPGSGGGIGNGTQGGVGSGDGPGFGPGRGGGIAGLGRRGAVTAPALVYKIEPEYSEQARKAKYQGTVVLSIEVDEDGKPRAFPVVQGLGLGLDEKAIEAVSRWKFRPAYRDGRAVTAPATIEVNFRLL
jgi:protein TonB